MEPLFGGRFIFNNVRNQWAPFIEELLDHVQAMGVDVITHNCEYAPSQFEINYRPAFGLAGADKGFTFKNAVKEFVQRAGVTTQRSCRSRGRTVRAPAATSMSACGTGARSRTPSWT